MSIAGTQLDFAKRLQQQALDKYRAGQIDLATYQKVTQDATDFVVNNNLEARAAQSKIERFKSGLSKVTKLVGKVVSNPVGTAQEYIGSFGGVSTSPTTPPIVVGEIPTAQKNESVKASSAGLVIAGLLLIGFLKK